MNASAPEDSETAPATDAPARIQPVHKPEGAANLDPISGEPHAHPVGVGIGALGAGAAGSLIGAILGPVGAVIGAALGAVAGGLAGKEVAETSEHKEAAHPEENAAAPASFAGDSQPAEDTCVADDLSRASVESAEAPTGHSGLGHVAAASLISEEAPIAGGFSAPTRAPDPIRDDMESQAAPETVPFNASASAGEDFAPGRLPLTPEDTDVHAASAPNDVPKIDESKGPLGHDLLFEHGDVSNTGTQPSKESGNHSGSGENTPESTVRTRAYYNYLDRQQSGRSGDELGDWVEAEYDVLKG